MSSLQSQFIADVKALCGKKHRHLFNYIHWPFSLNAHDDKPIFVKEWVDIAMEIPFLMKHFQVRRFQFHCGIGNHSTSGRPVMREILMEHLRKLKFIKTDKPDEHGIIVITLRKKIPKD